MNSRMRVSDIRAGFASPERAVWIATTHVLGHLAASLHVYSSCSLRRSIGILCIIEDLTTQIFS